MPMIYTIRLQTYMDSKICVCSKESVPYDANISNKQVLQMFSNQDNLAPSHIQYLWYVDNRPALLCCINELLKEFFLSTNIIS